MAATFQALQRLSLEWHPYQIAGGRSDISILARTAKDLAATVKTTLSLANVAMELVKLAATLQQVNPLLMALEALADDVLNQLYNLKEAGFYYLYVDPYYKKNVAAKPAFTYGFEQLRNQAGDRLWLKEDVGPAGVMMGTWSETTTTPSKAELQAGTHRPYLATPRKLIPGGYNPYDVEKATVDPLASLSPYPRFSTMEVLDEFTKAFDDESDVPRYKARVYPGAPQNGDIVYDEYGAEYSGWSKQGEYSIPLFDKGLEHQDGNIITDFKAARVAVNTKISSGRPNIKGVTNFTSGCGAVVIVIGCPTFDVFARTFNEFSDMFQDLPEFAARTGKQLWDSFTDILEPEPVKVKLTQCDEKYGLFEAGDIIGGEKFESVGKIESVNANSVIATTMSTTKSILRTDDAGATTQVTEPMNMNPESTEYPTARWKDMEVEVIPIRSADGINNFISGDTVYQMEERGRTPAPENLANYVIKGGATVGLPMPQRVYPKTAKVAAQQLKVLPKSVPPNFGGIQIKDIIPGWGEFFQQLENFVLQLKGMISDSVQFIQDLIDTIKAIEEFLERLIKIITDFLKFFEKQLPATGCYALYIENVQGGTEEIKMSIQAAKGSLPDLGYAAGVMFVGLEVAGVNPIELLATVLGLRRAQ